MMEWFVANPGQAFVFCVLGLLVLALAVRFFLPIIIWALIIIGGLLFVLMLLTFALILLPVFGIVLLVWYLIDKIRGH